MEAAEREAKKAEAQRMKDAERVRTAMQREAKRQEAAAEKEKRAEERKRQVEDRKKWVHLGIVQVWCRVAYMKPVELAAPSDSCAASM